MLPPGFERICSKTERFIKPLDLVFGMTIKIRAHGIYLDTLKKSVHHWKVSAATKTELLQFVGDLDVGKVNRGRRISEGRQAKYLNSLKIPLLFFNKAVTSVTTPDVERFERALSSDQIISQWRQRPYSAATKVDIRKALKVYLRWRLGEAKAVALAGWLDTRDKEKTPEFLTEQEVELLFRRCRTPEQRYIVAMLFDSGARAEEFINIRCEDIRLPEGKENFLKIALREEFSKTKGRTISLYWRHSPAAVTDYVKERLAQGLKPQDPVFAKTYDAMRMYLARLGRMVLKRRVYPHLFRHSSATYYATKLNRQELCYRYGWRFSSNMPDVYISRSGMENKELDQKFAATELSAVKNEFAVFEQAAKIKDDRIMQLEKTLADLKSNVTMISEVLRTNPSIAEVEAALLRKKRAQSVTL
jgi:integrase